jgi:uncharacterized membrane protein YdjX (TVP38/TMEM64 family)
MPLKPFVARYHRILTVLAFLLALGLIAHATLLQDEFSVAHLRQVLHANLLSGIAAFVLLFAVGNLMQVPGWIFLASAVVVLGRTTGGFASYLAACTSCVCTFWVVRAIGSDALQRLDSKFAAGLVARLHAHPVRNVALLRTLFQTLPALNYTLALSGIRFRHYLLGTLLGLPLPIALYCVFFNFLAAHLSLG